MSSVIDLQKCVESVGVNRVPHFGYPLMNFESDLKPKNNISVLLLGRMRSNTTTKKSLRK